MKYAFLTNIVMASMLAACAGDVPGTPSTNGQQIVDPTDRALAAVTANLPAGTTVASASEADLARAVRRTVRAHPELSGEIVRSISKVSPGRTEIVKKAVAAASKPYLGSRGRGGEH